MGGIETERISIVCVLQLAFINFIQYMELVFVSARLNMMLVFISIILFYQRELLSKE